jgi:subtilisin family serine protease
VATTCYDGAVANVVGADDPFYVNAWHLKNTGPNQIVSAALNDGVSGIDANVENVHKGGKGCTGKGVTIAIVDSGLEIGHEDLVDNVVTGKSWNFSNNAADPSPPLKQTEGDHGTAVAGVAAARGWNGKGSRGLAPMASVLGFALIADAAPAPGVSNSDMTYLSFGARALADATRNVVALFGNRADTASIFNFSAGSDYAAPPPVNELSPTELAAKYGTGNLRAGLGAVYFQSAGNEFVEMASGSLPDGTVLEVDCPSLFETDAALLGGELSNPKGMTCGSPNHEPSGKPYFYQVAAMHNTGKASSYSSAGASNWITGFGGEDGTDQAAIISTDNSGCASGNNNTDNKFILLAKVGEILNKLIADLFGDANSKDVNCNYTGRFNGTSAAAPSVSGVVALMLEANPKLSWQDVGYVLAKTARKVDTSIASGANKVTFFPTAGSGAWNIEDPWITNAAGFNFQNRYGFGLIDADAAVKLAIGYSVPAGRRAAPLVATGSSATSTRVDSVGLNFSSVTFAGTGAVSGPMRLDLTLTNNTGVALNPGFLQFILENTVTGTKSIVLPAFTSWYEGGKKFPIKAGAQQQFRFQTNAFYGEPIVGIYKVYVLDFSGASGVAGKALAFTPTLTSFSL